MLKFQLFWVSFRHAFSKEQFLKEIEADFRRDWQWTYSKFSVQKHDDFIKMFGTQFFRVIFTHFFRSKYYFKKSKNIFDKFDSEPIVTLEISVI